MWNTNLRFSPKTNNDRMRKYKEKMINVQENENPVYIKFMIK